jgi:uncharacterized delta-60 repeat protein
MNRKIKRRSHVNVMAEILEYRRLLSAGDLNPNFGGGGGVVEGNIRDTNDATSLVVQSDGKLILVGDTAYSTGSKVAFVERINHDGSVDDSFNQNGVNTLDLGSSSDVVATKVALQSDGKIIMVGTVGDVATFTGDFFVARFNTDGTLDTSFNGKGYRVIDFGGLDSAAGVVVDQTTGQIVMAGASVSITTGTGGIALAFVNPDGTMNTNFGDETGMVVTKPAAGTIEAATSLEQVGNDYVVSGFSLNSSTQASQMLLAEFSSSGRLNRAFGTDGRAFASFGNTVEVGVDAAYDPTTGDIYEVGATANGAIDLPPGLPSGTGTTQPTTADFAIACFNPDGTLNTNFNGTGTKTLDFNGDLDAATSVSVQGDGKIIVTGGSQLSSGRSVTAVARLNPDGSLDTTFAPSTSGDISTNDTSISPQDVVFNPVTDDEDGEEIIDIGDSNGAFGAALWVNDDDTVELYIVGHNKDSADDGDYYFMDLETGYTDHQTYTPADFSIYPDDDDCVGPPEGLLNFSLILSQPMADPFSVRLDASSSDLTSTYNFGSLNQIVTFPAGTTSQTISLNYDEIGTSATSTDYQIHLSPVDGSLLGVGGASVHLDYVYPNLNYLQTKQIMPIKFPPMVVGGGKTSYSTNVTLFNNYSMPNAKTKGGGKSTAGLEKGSVTITVYGSRNQALDTSTDTVLGTLKTNISLKPQQSITKKVKIAFPAVTKIANDYLIAAVTGTGVSTASTDFVVSSSRTKIEASTVALVAAASNSPVTANSGGKVTASFSVMNTGSAAAVGKINFSAVITNSSGVPVYYYGPPYGGSARSATVNIQPGGTGKASFSFSGLPNSFVPAGTYSIVINLISSSLLVANTTDGSVIGSIPLTVTG